ncbi:hypothetical protein [Flavobacterium sp. NRK1]|uniref:hypothetical protein n=1 Tax=Flavobacterium sp. NRK1 TaxID=2954929 RepID=UPI00209361F4|nr:hypothetical protein [Flavobacterium sp. NRK1]MCO6147505.1 hypothetical protein [Flavobacterium sp. NRK1]
MRNLDIILKEIVELSEIKSAYKHYLASNRSLTEVENTTQVQANRRIITKSIEALYMELLTEKTKYKTLVKSKITTKTITHTADEKNAILHFNHDKRFTITE